MDTTAPPSATPTAVDAQMARAVSDILDAAEAAAEADGAGEEAREAEPRTAPPSPQPMAPDDVQALEYLRFQANRAQAFQGRVLFARQYDISARIGGNPRSTHIKVSAARYPRLGGVDYVAASYTHGAGLPKAAGLDGVCCFGWADGSSRPVFLRRGGYPAELHDETRYGPCRGTAPGLRAGKETAGWEYLGSYRVSAEPALARPFQTLPPHEQEAWIDNWSRKKTYGDYDPDTLRAVFRVHPPKVDVHRLTFASYDEQLYADLKATQDARLRRMRRGRAAPAAVSPSPPVRALADAGPGQPVDASEAPVASSGRDRDPPDAESQDEHLPDA